MQNASAFALAFDCTDIGVDKGFRIPFWFQICGTLVGDFDDYAD
jgi:hypothetical protein